MRLIFLTGVVMLAFAGNSILNRLAVGSGDISAMGFAQIRLVAGVVMLLGLCHWRRQSLSQSPRMSLFGGGALALYMIGFSLAYRNLDAGLGALILFGVVQITMFGWGALRGAVVAPAQALGALLAFGGLAYVLWPTGTVQVPLSGAAFMAAAGLGWAIYSLLGRQVKSPLAATTQNFIWASVMLLPLTWWLAEPLAISVTGAGLAIVSGAVTSGLGYALWYRVLPQLQPAVAATVQLSVPVIAILVGAIGLGESLSVQLLIGTLAVLGGIALVITRAPRPAG
ncbi:DMT family transporter [Parasedimentitalea psychrophila]|uniref:DMT family transporter n=1 Tax=Parasedimentitalea psychrophila TaxID=2997337 RepID=A0A9Y2P5B8_9RHOB|nr:DMT family transporter [Parasedimentitalea psychrophila]WIY23415.1 DMT family transporter [Parasedimentitalea psychrophila]